MSNMIDKLYKFMMFIFSASVIVSFFLPWVSVNTQPIGKVATVLTPENGSSFTKISGFRIPIVANSCDSRLIVNIVKIFKPSMQDVEKKIWFVWFVPILAWLIFILTSRFSNSKLMGLICTVIGFGIFLFAFYKIETANLENVVLRIKIEQGFWFTIWAYLGIGILGFLRFKALSFRKKRW